MKHEIKNLNTYQITMRFETEENRYTERTLNVLDKGIIPAIEQAIRLVVMNFPTELIIKLWYPVKAEMLD